MSSTALFALLFAIVVVMALLKGQPRRGSGGIGFPYQRAGVLFSVAERSFLGALDQAVGPDYRVFGKVRLADLAKVRPGLGKSARQGALNRIGAKHVDFLVCRTSDLAIVCAVELNDRSHASKNAQARDRLVAGVCDAIGLPLVTVPARLGYSTDDIRARLQGLIEPAVTAGLSELPGPGANAP